MAKVKSLMMDLEEQFYDEAAKIIMDCETESEAENRCEALRSEKYNFMDIDDVAGQVSDFWIDYSG